MSEMQFEIMEVTPELAAKWLGKNEGNRKLREPRAAALAKSMDAGKFRLTHQPVAFSPRGRLLDGQHRLRAICLSGKTIRLVVATNVPESAFEVIDAGLPRKMFERLRSDPKQTALATTMYRLMIGNRPPQEYEANLLIEILGPAMVKLEQVAKANRKGGGKISKATEEAAICLRMMRAIKDDDFDAQVRINWKLEKLRRADMVGAPPIIVAYHKQLLDGVKNTDIAVSPQVDQFARAWRAFDPERESLNRLQIDDHGLVMREARTEFRDMSQGIFDE